MLGNFVVIEMVVEISNIFQVRDAAAKVSGAVGEVEVRQTEPLVVPFGVN